MKEHFKFSDRAAEKARMRARDQERLDKGEVSPADLQRENSFFQGRLKHARIGFSPKCRPKNGDKYSTLMSDDD